MNTPLADTFKPAARFVIGYTDINARGEVLLGVPTSGTCSQD